MRSGALEHLEGREVGRGGWRGCKGEKYSGEMCRVPLSSG